MSGWPTGPSGNSSRYSSVASRRLAIASSIDSPWVVVPVSGFKAVYPPSGAGISTAVSIMIGAPDAQANGALSPQTACRCLGSSAGELKLSLPDQLATQAKAAGLLTSEAIERIVREAIRKAAAQRLIEYGRRLRASPRGPTSAKRRRSKEPRYANKVLLDADLAELY